MVHRKGVASLAACAALACAGIVRAESASAVPDNGFLLRPAYLDDSAEVSATRPTTSPATEPAQSQPAAAPPTRPLMLGLEQIGIGKTLENANVTFGGYIEGGWTISNQNPPGNTLVGRVFDTKNKRVVLDQLDFFFDRPVDYGKAAQNHTIDIGGHVDVIYGWDSGLIHSDGVLDNPSTRGESSTGGHYKSRTHPENQIDLNQAYVDIALPIGSGLRIRAGKFVTLLGEEVINPTGNALYSHSYMFGFAIPFTQTGVMGEYKINDDWLVDGGITRGWDQTLKDNNGDPDFLGEVTFTPQESDFLKKWKFIGNLSLGPQTTHDNADWWTVAEFLATFTATDKLTLAVDVTYGDAPHALTPKSAQWYGVAGYASYVLNDYFTLNGRAEWYDDNDGFTFGVPGTLSVYEATVGVAIKPLPHDNIGQNLTIRPEVRGDYAAKRFFDAGKDYYQVTFGMDAYFTF